MPDGTLPGLPGAGQPPVDMGPHNQPVNPLGPGYQTKPTAPDQLDQQDQGLPPARPFWDITGPISDAAHQLLYTILIWIGLFMILGIGIYLAFQPEINAAVKEASKVAAEAAVTAAAA